MICLLLILWSALLSSSVMLRLRSISRRSFSSLQLKTKFNHEALFIKSRNVENTLSRHIDIHCLYVMYTWLVNIITHRLCHCYMLQSAPQSLLHALKRTAVTVVSSKCTVVTVFGLYFILRKWKWNMFSQNDRGGRGHAHLCARHWCYSDHFW